MNSELIIFTVDGGALPAVVVHEAGGPGEVLEAARGREQSAATLNLGHLDVPLSVGRGRGGGDDSSQVITLAGGIHIHVLREEQLNC